jgi:hypothetical protein
MGAYKTYRNPDLDAVEGSQQQKLIKDWNAEYQQFELTTDYSH